MLFLFIFVFMNSFRNLFHCRHSMASRANSKEKAAYRLPEHRIGYGSSSELLFSRTFCVFYSTLHALVSGV